MLTLTERGTLLSFLCKNCKIIFLFSSNRNLSYFVKLDTGCVNRPHYNFCGYLVWYRQSCCSVYYFSFAPIEMQAELGGLAGTFFQIGLIIWGLFFIVVFLVTCCYCKFCREESKDGNTCLCC